MKQHTPLPPGAWLGVVGGGQLGRMFCQAAQTLGYQVAVLDPHPNSPAGAVAHWHVSAPYDDPDALRRFGERCDAVTTEFENVPASTLDTLATWCRVAPVSTAVAVAQDRMLEKRTLQRLGASVVPYAEIHTPEHIEQAPPHCFPGILKSARLGYDGKGQVRVQSRAEAREAFEQLGRQPCVLEAFVTDLALEVSVVLARDAAGHITHFPVASNEHRKGILFHCAVPTAVAEPLAQAVAQAPILAHQVAAGLEYEGVLCVECFITREGRLLVNEIAPRPHNSGHYTLDACSVNQFEQQVRVLAGLPLAQPELLAPAVMVNVLGDQWFDAAGAHREPAWAKVLAVPGTRLHLYGKAEARRGRKMGHVTCVGATPAVVEQRVRQVLAALDMSWDAPW